jgi:hypothetical protein
MKNEGKTYGIVEGFFSEPLPIWSKGERRETIGFVAKKANKINTYVYCPKDDPFVTGKYDVLYPKEELESIKRLIAQCNITGIKFIYGLNPVVDNLENEQEVRKGIINKLEQLISAGCMNFMVLFDDIPLAYDVVAGTKIENSFDKVIEIINEIYRDIRGMIEGLWFCGPDYCYLRETPVTSATRKLNKDIEVIWSGNGIFTKKITQKDIARVKKILGPETKIIYWVNYPVNDCEQAVGTFNLGGFYPVKRKIMNQLAGIIVNPMRESMSNLPFYCTFSEWAEGGNYERRQSYLKAMTGVLGLDSKFVNSVLKFSSRNIVDKRVQVFKELTDNPGKINKYGKRFTNSIESLIAEMKIWNRVYKDQASGDRVSKKDFEMTDWFPTKTYIPRYLWEIYRIVEERRRLYRKGKSGGIPEIVKQFKERYCGSFGLKISEIDSRNYLVAIRKLVESERSDFFEYLNDRKVSQKDRVSMLNKRRSLNRFTIN